MKRRKVTTKQTSDQSIKDVEVKEIAACFPQLREKSVHFLFVGLVDFVLLGEAWWLLINVGAQGCDGEIKRWRERSLLADSDVVVLEDRHSHLCCEMRQ